MILDKRNEVSGKMSFFLKQITDVTKTCLLPTSEDLEKARNE